VRGQSGAPEALTLTPGPRNPGTDSFRDHRPFEFGKDTKARFGTTRRYTRSASASSIPLTEVINSGYYAPLTGCVVTTPGPSKRAGAPHYFALTGFSLRYEVRKPRRSKA
jgi:hypothetical protein